MTVAESPFQPSLPWRVASSIVMGVTGTVFRIFLFGENKTEVNGLHRILDLLDRRHEIEARQRGLITGKIPSQVSDADGNCH